MHDEPGLSVTAMRVEHPPLVDRFALLRAGGREVVMSGDTAYLPALADFARGGPAAARGDAGFRAAGACGAGGHG